jgi:hypothetical protein
MLHLILGKIHACWKPVVAVAVAGALLLPVPAFAFTWLTDWGIFDSQTRRVPTPNVTTSDFDSGGNLTVDMGQFGSKHPFSSQMVALRAFSVDNPTETLNLADSFESLQKFSDLKVNVVAINLNNFRGGVSVLDNAVLSAGPQPQDFQYANQTSTTLTQGIYVLMVSVKYQSNRFGLRNYFVDASPFSFTFNGI